jgi:hypothetical protein
MAEFQELLRKEDFESFNPHNLQYITGRTVSDGDRTVNIRPKFMTSGQVNMKSDAEIECEMVGMTG